jgi:hypothetical protein
LPLLYSRVSEKPALISKQIQHRVREQAANEKSFFSSLSALPAACHAD